MSLSHDALQALHEAASKDPLCPEAGPNADTVAFNCYVFNAVPEILTLIAERDALRGALEVVANAPLSGWTIAQGIARAALGGNEQ